MELRSCHTSEQLCTASQYLKLAPVRGHSYENITKVNSLASQPTRTTSSVTLNNPSLAPFQPYGHVPWYIGVSTTCARVHGGKCRNSALQHCTKNTRTSSIFVECWMDWRFYSSTTFRQARPFSGTTYLNLTTTRS